MADRGPNAGSRSTALWVLALLASLAAAPAGAAEGPRARRLKSYRWVDGYGKLVQVPFPLYLEWTWQPVALEGRSGSELAPRTRPMPRIWLDIPKGYELEFRGGTRSSPAEKTGRPPFAARGKTVAFDVEPKHANLEFNLRLAEGGGKAARDLSLIVLSASDRPEFLVHPSCERAGVVFSRRDVEEPSFQYAGIECEEAGEEVTVRWLYSEGVKARLASSAPPLAEGTGWSSFRVRKPEMRVGPDGLPQPVQLSQFRIVEGDAAPAPNGAPTLVYAWYRAKQRVRGSVNLGFTYVSYEEPAQSVKLTELGLTSKVAASYFLVADRVSVDANAFVTLVPLNLDVAAAPKPARFWGVNLRAGYHFPADPSRHRLSVLGGWYYWGMIVPGEAYGFKAIYAPQLFVSVRSPARVERGYQAYVKVSPLAPSPGRGFLANRELAAGGGREIFRVAGGKPVLLGLDVAQTLATIDASGGGTQSLSLLSATTSLTLLF